MAPPTTPTKQKTISELVVYFGTTHIGQKVGRGECWDLPNDALKFAKARTPNDLGQDLYVWGDEIKNLADAQPGDILQFEGVQIRRDWVRADGRSAWETLNFGHRHSAIVEKVDSGLFFTTLNAHVNGKKTVMRIRMNLSPENIKTGKITLYRPTARNGGR